MTQQHINEFRVQDMIECIARFTSTPGKGTTRLTYSAEHRDVRDYLLGKMKEAGLQTREDAVGNLFGRIEGKNPALPPVLVGSHFDSVPNGGNFDGPAGVIAGLETAFVFQELGLKPERSVEIIAMIEEEGGRFGSGLLGSRLLTGQVKQQELYELKDQNGISVAQAMSEFGLDPSRSDEVALSAGSLHAFLELHIEQGPVLEQNQEDIGIVTEVVSLSQIEVTVIGAAGHAGTTPMNARKDAMVGAAAVIARIPDIVIEVDKAAVGTVGRIVAQPGGANVIPNSVSFSVDIRSPQAENVAEIKGKLRTELKQLLDDGLTFEINEKITIPSTPMAKEIQEQFAKDADASGIKRRWMPSGAGHDAMILSKITQTGLIFVPSRDGISHAPEEWTDYDKLAKGIEVIFRTAKALSE
ncbi:MULTISPECIES: Zn-dependent hydrolase [Halomonadaceae]|uniref:Zn-dependent hydrolase n=1 Tax=Halomonadaceae TaxID=28256 RepID=UPI000C3343E5|nr:Zn-dependent hydrolase [Halomonas sp. MES3-P3E]PKG48590.1 Zn-dependent hydrolase [Halomonas sp. MES3-P3E]